LDVSTLLRQATGTPSEPKARLEQDKAPFPLCISLTGLQSMHSPESTSILYAPPKDPTERLYDFCLALQKHFKEFMISDDRPLRLHATIVNTIYAKGRKPAGRSSNSRGSGSEDRSQGHGPDAKASLKMDARDILQNYHDYSWAEDFELDRIAICEMGAKKILDAAKVRVLDERYTEVASTALSA
jgi:activating signal cointegrator complex subunit 1